MPQLIDIKHLEKYVAGDDALRDEILTIFHDRVETLCEEIDIHATDDAWHDITHAIKGAALGVGAWEVGDLCEDCRSLVGDIDNKIDERTKAAALLKEKIAIMMADARNLRDGETELAS